MTYSKAEGKMITYINGAYSAGGASETQTANLTLPKTPSAQWFCIGNDAYPAPKSVDPTSTNTKDYEYCPDGPFVGEIVFAKLYDKAVSAEEVAVLYKQITDREALTKVGDLNTALTVTLPAKDAAGADLTTEGWKLMNSMGTTDAQITTFLGKISAL